MIGVVAILKIQEGKNAEFEATVADLQKNVREKEAGNIQYDLFKSGDDPQTYVFMEQYTDGDALSAHGKSDHFRAAGAKFADVLAGAPDIKILQKVS